MATRGSLALCLRRRWPFRAARADQIVGALLVVFALVVYVSLLRASGGVDRNALRGSYQLLDVGTLRREPVTSLWYLHTQPPLYNALVAALARLPFDVANSLTVVFGGAFVATALGCFAVLRRLGIPALGAGLVSAVAVANPNLLGNVRIAGYEVLVALLVTATVWLLLRYLQSPTLPALVALAATLSAAALTRSLLHPLWAFAVLAVAIIARRPPVRRRMLLLAGLPLLLVSGVMVKNAALFGETTMSSWSGFNAQRGVVAAMTPDQVESAIDAGEVSVQARIPPWEPLDAYPPTTGGGGVGLRPTPLSLSSRSRTSSDPSPFQTSIRSATCPSTRAAERTPSPWSSASQAATYSPGKSRCC